jgi:SAM-dependent methyltransferase
MDDNTIKKAVKDRYRSIALTNGSCCCGCDCGDATVDVNPLVDYSADGIQVVEGSDLGLGCGMPTRFVEILPGQTVLDLGSGAGIDVFLAAQKVGAQGLAIGVDMTEEMITKARTNAEKAGIANVDFRLGEIENLPVDDASVDLVLSNCVINLVPDKRRAFAEIHRVLKSGGKFCISDVVTYGQIPEEIRQDMSLWAGCVAGAMDKEDYLALIRENGFDDLKIHQYSIYDAVKHEDYGMGSLTLEGVKQ